MNKRPAFQFYPADWRKDPQLQMCDMATQGIWINILCCMWEANEEGKLEGSWEDFARLLGISVIEFKKFFIQAKRHKFCDVLQNVTECDGNVTLINRRMYAAFLERERAKRGMRKHRASSRYENVTPPSSSSSSSSSSKNPPNPPRGFDTFWKSYPRKIGKQAAFKIWKKLNPTKELLAKILTAIEQQKKCEQWQKDGGQYIPHPKTWLNEGRWDDEMQSKKTIAEIMDE